MNMLQVIEAGAGTKRELPRSCPFCGEDPPLAARPFGTMTRMYLVGCENDDCPAQPSVAGDTVDHAWKKWNERRG